VKTITVSPLSVGGIVAGGGAVCSGSNKVLKISGHTGTIQWMYATDGIHFMNVPTGSAVAPTFVTASTSGTASSYLVNNITGTAYFKAVLKSGVCSTSESNVVVFNTATTASQVDLSVESAQVCSGSATSLYLPLFVGDVKIQKSINWYSARPTWTTVTLKMTQTLYNGQYGAFSTGALTQSTAYRAVSSIGNCAPVVYGSIAVIGVNVCGATREIETPVAITTPFEVIAYPNPSNNVFNFKVNGADDETVSILVFDMTGRQIENKEVNASDVENLALGQNYSSGVYNVIVAQGMNTRTVRLVKK
jgi:Secretion system C-terminal sorting domain